ncbi:butyrate kinase [Acetobacterium paludosum]|uniref:Probable butyrate kinase n=1 Tax=Acetobacterium paludosum TaxID=52693 RepID=A0A923HUJ3_9FIRM|nr:butyrate kinase [Acetobacterium paludosum]MBC3888571.1 butyrate kinase [Acetobacterium paludosum]
MKNAVILTINPGSTSTKIGVFENENELFSASVEHQSDALEAFQTINQQFDFRKDTIMEILENHHYDTKKLSAVVGRGGLLPPIKSGGYTVNEAMKNLIWGGALSEHASNLGALLADAIAGPLGIPAFIYDGVSSDEMEDIARITGFPEIQRQSFCHVLNSKAMGRKYARGMEKNYADMNLVIAHLGGGISISAHKKGRIIDVISDDSGPFSPERSGSIPLFALVELIYKNHYEKKELLKKIRGNGGLKAHLGTRDCREIEERILAGDTRAKQIYEAQAYQIAKGIGEMAVVLKGKIDGILLTGGMAYSEKLTGMIAEYVGFIASVKCLPGEIELEALALGGLRLLRGEEKPHLFAVE